ncbi:hypothetical protein OpiT1DRAFT_04121 [Opitutaceae bacterium TAV1]|nr:hypothetical protein OpiT1DRAFT_04121 [Opitutaceae bacterium TAV1]
MKIRRAGFPEAADTEEMFTGFPGKFRAGRVIPALWTAGTLRLFGISGYVRSLRPSFNPAA